MRRRRSGSLSHVAIQAGVRMRVHVAMHCLQARRRHRGEKIALQVLEALRATALHGQHRSWPEAWRDRADEPGCIRGSSDSRAKRLTAERRSRRRVGEDPSWPAGRSGRRRGWSCSRGVLVEGHVLTPVSGSGRQGSGQRRSREDRGGQARTFGNTPSTILGRCA